MSRSQGDRIAARPYQIEGVYPADRQRCHAMAAMEIQTILGSEEFLKSDADDITRATGVKPTQHADRSADYLIWDIRPKDTIHSRWGEDRDNAVYIALDRQIGLGPQIHIGHHASGAYVLCALRTLIVAMCPDIVRR